VIYKHKIKKVCRADQNRNLAGNYFCMPKNSIIQPALGEYGAFFLTDDGKPRTYSSYGVTPELRAYPIPEIVTDIGCGMHTGCFVGQSGQLYLAYRAGGAVTQPSITDASKARGYIGQG
jgi:hypothetical protein